MSSDGQHSAAAAKVPAFLLRHPHYGAGARRQRSGAPGTNLLSALSDSAAAAALLTTPPATLAATHNLSEADVEELLRRAAGVVSPLRGPCAVAAVFAGAAAVAPIPTGIPTLDRQLLGGLRPRFVVELTGGAGSGSAAAIAFQWACAAVVDAARSADDATAGHVLWLHTAPNPPAIARGLALLRGDAADAAVLRGGFLTMPVPTSLEEFHETQLPFIARHLAARPAGRGGVRLLVLDSLSQLTHRSFSALSGSDGIQRQGRLVALVQDLKQLAAAHNLCVLLLTDSTTTATAATAAGDGAARVPGEFGRMLYHAVNVRLRADEELLLGAGGAVPEWGCVLRVAKSPVCGPVAVVLRAGAAGTWVEAQGAAARLHSHLPGDLIAGVDPADHLTVPSFVTL